MTDKGKPKKHSVMVLQIIFAKIFILTFLTQSSFAAVPTLTNLDQGQTEAAFKTFAAAMTFRPLEPASSYGKFFGFSFGPVVTMTSASALNGAISGSNFSLLPTADLYAGVQLPFGIGLEVGFVPNVKITSIKFNKRSANLKWTVTDLFLEISPIAVALRGTYTDAQVSYAQTANGINTTVGYDTTIIGTHVSASFPLPFAEPYVGIGWLKHKSTLGATGSTALFNQTYSTSTSVDSTGESLWYYGGVELKLFMLTLSGQMDHLFDVNTYSAKLGFKF